MAISEHQVRIYRVLARGDWLTAHELATAAQVSPRTARLHLTKLVQHSIAERSAVFPGYRYRSTGAGDRDYIAQLKSAAESFGSAV